MKYEMYVMFFNYNTYLNIIITKLIIKIFSKDKIYKYYFLFPIIKI